MSASNKDSSNHRVCDRLKTRKVLLLELEDGAILRGHTVDVSPRGVLLVAEEEPPTGLQGQSGTLFMISDKGQFSSGYPCRVVRSRGVTIALEIDKKAAAAFGNDMTRELLGL